jgi:hypothetical protein
VSTVSRPKATGVVHTTVHDAVASITIRNPARRNALSTSASVVRNVLAGRVTSPSQTPQIMADAARAILTRRAKE